MSGFRASWALARRGLPPWSSFRRTMPPGLSDAERAVQRLVIAMVGRYITHTMIVNGLELAPPVPSIFDEG